MNRSLVKAGRLLCFGMAVLLLVAHMGGVPAKAYTDDGAIANAGAVRLLGSLQIMRGHANGSIEPKGLLTRAQAAKMLYVARNGGIDDGAPLFAGTGAGPFRDVPAGFWATGYIRYSAAMGFVSGRGNGIFDPGGNITGYELMKILLGALGYKADTEGFRDCPDWKLRVLTAAHEAGLTEGFAGDPGRYITRDEAAGMVANMVYADTVTYRDGDRAPGAAFAAKYLGLEVVEGVLSANDAVSLEAGQPAAPAGKVRLRTSQSGVTPIVSETIDLQTFGFSAGEALLGQRVTVLVRRDSQGKIVKIFDFYASKENVVLEIDRNTIAGLDARNLDGAHYFINYAETNANYTGGNGFNYSYATDATWNRFWQRDVVDRITPVRAIDHDGDGKFDYLFETTYTVATVLESARGVIALSDGSGTYTSENATGIAGLVPGDVVLYRAYGEKTMLEKTEALTATVQKYSVDPASHTESLTLDSVTYNRKNGVAGMPGDLFTGRPVGSKGVYSMFRGSPVFVQAHQTAAHYALVTDSAKVGFDFLVKAVLDDGTTGIYAISAYNGAAPSASLNDANLANLKDGLFRYVKNGDGALSLSDPVNSISTGPVVYHEGSSNLMTGYYLHASTPVFVRDTNGTYRVFRGTGTVPGLSASEMTIVRGEPLSAELSLYLADAVFVKNAAYTGTTGSDVWYVNSPLSVIDAEGNRSFTAAAGAAGKEFIARSDVHLVPGTLYRLRIDIDGYVSEANPVPSVKGFATAAEDGLLLVGTITHVADGANSVEIQAFSYNDATKFLIVDGYNITGGSARSIVCHSDEQLRIDTGHHYTDWTGFYTGVQPRAKYELEALDTDSDGTADLVYCYVAPRV